METLSCETTSKDKKKKREESLLFKTILDQIYPENEKTINGDTTLVTQDCCKLQVWLWNDLWNMQRFSVFSSIFRLKQIHPPQAWLLRGVSWCADHKKRNLFFNSVGQTLFSVSSTERPSQTLKNQQRILLHLWTTSSFGSLCIVRFYCTGNLYCLLSHRDNDTVEVCCKCVQNDAKFSPQLKISSVAFILVELWMGSNQ